MKQGYRLLCIFIIVVVFNIVDVTAVAQAEASPSRQSPDLSGQSRGLTDSVLEQIARGDIRDLPSTVAIGLFNPDPLLDVACYADGKVEVYRNLGNGAFELVWEKWSNGVVKKLEWRKSRMIAEGIPDISSWADLLIFYTDGKSEVISHEEMIPPNHLLASAPNVLLDPSLDFREVWRSRIQENPSTLLAIADIDGDGAIEVAYSFFPNPSPYADTLVVYENQGHGNYTVDWDTIITGAFAPMTISDVDNDDHKELVMARSGNVVLLECYGPGQYSYYTTNILYSAPPFKVLVTDIDHDGIRELTLHTSNPSPLPGQDATYIYVAEFSSKDSTTMWFNIETARYYYFTFDMAVGQLDGVGRDEIILGGSFPIDYLWYDGTTWRMRRISTGLPSSVTAPMFVNLDTDTTLELFIGGIGPIGHGSCYALDYVSDTTWAVLWADSSLRNTPLSVNAGILAGEFVVAGANTWDRSPLDTLYTQLHVYQSSGVKLGIWQRDSASVQNFHFLDIDSNGKTNLVTAVLSPYAHHFADYEYTGPTNVGTVANDRPLAFELLQNYPNPFNASTRIVYKVSSRDAVSLRVYNVLGQEVETLVNEVKEPGTYTVTFDASHFSSGVYFYRLQTHTQIITRKMVVLR